MARQFKFDAGLVSLFSQVTEASVADVVRIVAGRIAERAEEKTPVKSGNAAGSWQIGVGTPDLTTGIGSNGGNAQKLKQIRGDLPVYVTNDVAYACRLEHGYSKKAPSGMLRVALDTVKAELSSIIDQVRERNS